ncbi:MAG: GTPase domain-containing protein [candidate division Zixibacteria bacterium]|nr:GTPase domain-containing protein [candidate division Zixibacteria bacterium]
MVSINYSAREVCCKIVYYGPGLSGKTTNLQYVHTKVPSTTRGELISLATEADRTLYFDFLPINIGTINGFQAKFQLYTVPGQVYYNATRKLVLRGVDGVVFVADSQPDKMDENIEALANLIDNLKEYGYDVNELPLVIQYNKRDLPNIMTTEEMDQKLNTYNFPTFEASATVGTGVFDTLKLIIKLVLEKAKNSKVSSKSSKPAEEAPAPAAPSAPAAEPAAQATVSPAGQPDPDGPLADPAVQPLGNDPYAAPPAAPQVQGQPTAEVSTADMPATSATDDRIPAYRPYPGAKQSDSSGEAASETDDRPYPGMNQSEKALTNNDSVAGDQAAMENSGSLTPKMAPSLKRREQKKRSFFKKLFGIK